MSTPASRITDSEYEIMRVIWKAGRALPIAEIRKSLEGSKGWEYSTIKTLLRRLCDKGVVSAVKRDIFYYKAIVSEAEYNEYATQTLINRLYFGNAKNLVASLVDSRKLDKNDIEELRRMFRVGEDNE